MINILESFGAACVPLDLRPIEEWASEYIDLPQSYAIPGRFRVGPSRHLIEPLAAVKDHETRRVIVKKPTQTAGTMIADLSVPWFVANRPGPIMIAMQAEDVAEDHARARTVPVLKSCKAMAPYLPTDERKIGRTVIELANVNIYVVGATPSNLQSKSILFLIADEVWQWKPGRLEWAFARVTAFERVGLSKILVISQAGVKGDDLDAMWRSGTMEEWSVQCEGCKEHFIPRWTDKRKDGDTEREAGMMWDTNDITRPGGQWDFVALAPTIRFACPLCGHEHRDSPALKARWNASGKYVATNPRPSPGVRSFRWTSIPLDGWAGLVEQYLRAMDALHAGLAAPLVVFLQQRLAEDDDPERGHSGVDDAVTVAPAGAWPNEVVRFMAVDVQEGHFWVEVRAWAANGDSRQIFFGRALSEEELAQIQESHQVNNRHVGVDCRWSGGKRGGRAVYDMISRRGWFGLRGEDRRSFTHRDPKGKPFERLWSKAKYGDPLLGRAGAAGAQMARYYEWAELPIRGMVGRIRDGKGAKWECLPDEEYRKQLWAEVKRIEHSKDGRRVERWVQRRRDNHGFDLACMGCVMALMHPAIIILQTGAPAQGSSEKKTENNCGEVSDTVSQ